VIRWWAIDAQLLAQCSIIVFLLFALHDDPIRRRLGLAASALVSSGLLVRLGTYYLELDRWERFVPNPYDMPLRLSLQYRCDAIAAVCESVAWWLLMAGIYRSWTPPRGSDIRAPTSGSAPTALNVAETDGSEAGVHSTE